MKKQKTPHKPQRQTQQPGDEQNSLVATENVSLDKADQDHLTMNGTVTDGSKGIFRVQVDDTEHIIKATISGKMRKFKIMIVAGDRVKVKVSPYDLKTGFIVQRL